MGLKSSKNKRRSRSHSERNTMIKQVAEFFPDMQVKDLTVIKAGAVDVIQDFEAKIAKSKELYGDLKIFDLADKVKYEQVKGAHIVIKSLVSDIETRRTEVKAPVLDLGKWIDAEAKRLQAEVAPLLTHLETERKKYEAEEARVKKEKQDAIDAKMRARVEALKAVESVVDYPALVLMTDAHYEAHLKVETAKHEERQRQAAELARLQAEEAERKRLADEAEAKARREEAERLEAQRKAQEEAQAKIDAQLAEIARKEKAIADAKAKQEADEAARVAEEARKAREAEIAAKAAEKAREDAIAQAKAETERKEREAEENRKREEANAKAEALRLAAIEAAKPDAEKWLQFAKVVRGLQLPPMSTPKGEDVERLVKVNIENLAKLIEFEADKLTK